MEAVLRKPLTLEGVVVYQQVYSKNGFQSGPCYQWQPKLIVRIIM